MLLLKQQNGPGPPRVDDCTPPRSPRLLLLGHTPAAGQATRICGFHCIRCTPGQSASLVNIVSSGCANVPTVSSRPQISFGVPPELLSLFPSSTRHRITGPPLRATLQPHGTDPAKCTGGLVSGCSRIPATCRTAWGNCHGWTNVIETSTCMVEASVVPLSPLATSTQRGCIHLPFCLIWRGALQDTTPGGPAKYCSLDFRTLVLHVLSKAPSLACGA